MIVIRDDIHKIDYWTQNLVSNFSLIYKKNLPLCFLASTQVIAADVLINKKKVMHISI